MPDALEQQANGPDLLQPTSEVIDWSLNQQPNQAGDIPVTLVGEVPQALAPTPSPAAQNNASVLAAPATDEQNEAMRQKMIATQTQWTQRVSDAEQDLRTKAQAYEQKLHELNLAAQQPTADQPASPSFKDLLPPSQYEALDPDAKSLLGAVEMLMDGKVNALQGLNGDNAGNSEEVKALNTRLASLEGNQTQQRVATGLQEVKQVYGDQVAAQYQQQITNTISGIPGLQNAFQVMAIIDPVLAQTHAQRVGALSATQQTQQQQDATLAGVQPSPSAQSNARPFVDGESMMDSYMKANGLPAPPTGAVL